MLVKVLLLRCDDCAKPLGFIWNLDAYVFKERIVCYKCGLEVEKE